MFFYSLVSRKCYMILEYNLIEVLSNTESLLNQGKLKFVKNVGDIDETIVECKLYSTL